MLNFLIKSYRKIMELATWLILVVGGIWGIGYSLSMGGSFGMSILCMILGVIFAFIGELLIVPPLMILFSINSKLDDIKEILKRGN